MPTLISLTTAHGVTHAVITEPTMPTTYTCHYCGQQEITADTCPRCHASPAASPDPSTVPIVITLHRATYGVEGREGSRVYEMGSIRRQRESGRWTPAKWIGGGSRCASTLDNHARAYQRQGHPVTVRTLDHGYLGAFADSDEGSQARGRSCKAASQHGHGVETTGLRP